MLFLLTKLQQYESISGPKYTLRTYHSFFPCQGQGSRMTKKEQLIFLPWVYLQSDMGSPRL